MRKPKLKQSFSQKIFPVLILFLALASFIFFQNKNTVLTGHVIEQTLSNGYVVYSEEAISTNIPGRAISISTDTKNQPHIVTEYNTNDGINYYYKLNSNWNKQEPLLRESGADRGGTKPNIKIDSLNRAWLSFSKVGGGTGNYMALISSVSTLPFISWKVGASTYSGFVQDLAIDTFYTNKAYQFGDFIMEYNSDGSSSRSATSSPSNGGEKMAIEISPRQGQAGIIHSAIGGYSAVCSGYINSQLSSPICWASGNTYMALSGDDGRYIDLGVDLKNPSVAYLVSSYDGVTINIWDGTKMLFSPTNLYIVDKNPAQYGNGVRRFSPQFASAQEGGVFLCWTGSDNRIKLKYLSSSGSSSFGPTIDIGPGKQCAITSDSAGNLHLAYNNNGLKYRFIESPNSCKVGQVKNQNTLCFSSSLRGRCSFGTTFQVCNSERKFDWSSCSTPSPGSISEICNGIDDDCDGQTDEVCDKDGDLYLDQSVPCGNTIYRSWGYPDTLPVAGDYNGDGKSDLAIYGQQTGKWYISDINGNNILWDYNFGFNGGVPVAGDYNGDGKSDLAIYGQQTGKWYISDINGNNILWDYNFGFNGGVPVAGDYNGDGKSDLAIYGQQTGKWYISDINGTNMIWDKQFGYDGAVPSSGDFDGDGKSDLAVKDTITGKWYIESISDQSISYNSSLGDFTSMNGDYNNDGNIDIVKYFSTGVWELVLSSNNFILPSGNKGCVLKDLNDLDASITSTKVCTQNSDCTTTSTCIDGFCNLSNSLCYYVPNTHSCDDGLFCTVNDTCNQGFCTGTLRSCINENPGSQIFFCDEGEKKCLAEFSSCLTDQDCQSLTSSCVSSSCLNGVCSRVNIDGECNDENNCTVNDSCVSGTCSGVPLNLEDGNPLTYGTCLTNGTVIQEYFNFSGLSTNTSEDIWADTDLRINLSNSTNVGVSNNNSFFNQNRSDSNNPDGKNNSILFFVIFSVIILIILFSLFFFYYFGRKNKAVQKETNDSPKNSYPPSPNLSRTILKPMLYRQRPEFK